MSFLLKRPDALGVEKPGVDDQIQPRSRFVGFLGNDADPRREFSVASRAAFGRSDCSDTLEPPARLTPQLPNYQITQLPDFLTSSNTACSASIAACVSNRPSIANPSCS